MELIYEFSPSNVVNFATLGMVAQSCLYSQLAKQLEQAKIQVKQDIPVFTIIEPISVPTTRSKPDCTKSLLIWLFLGGVIRVGVVFGKEFIVPIKKLSRNSSKFVSSSSMESSQHVREICFNF